MSKYFDRWSAHGDMVRNFAHSDWKPEGSYVTEAAYLALMAERDAAVSMLNQWRDKYLAEAARHDKTRNAWGKEMAQMTRQSMSDGQEYGALLVAHERLKARLAACVEIFEWLLGERGEFPECPEKVEGKPYPFYWWRSELRERVRAAVAAETQGRAMADRALNEYGRGETTPMDNDCAETQGEKV